MAIGFSPYDVQAIPPAWIIPLSDTAYKRYPLLRPDGHGNSDPDPSFLVLQGPPRRRHEFTIALTYERQEILQIAVPKSHCIWNTI